MPNVSNFDPGDPPQVPKVDFEHKNAMWKYGCTPICKARHGVPGKFCGLNHVPGCPCNWNDETNCRKCHTGWCEVPNQDFGIFGNFSKMSALLTLDKPHIRSAGENISLVQPVACTWGTRVFKLVICCFIWTHHVPSRNKWKKKCKICLFNFAVFGS